MFKLKHLFFTTILFSCTLTSYTALAQITFPTEYNEEIEDEEREYDEEFENEREYDEEFENEREDTEAELERDLQIEEEEGPEIRPTDSPTNELGIDENIPTSPNQQIEIQPR